MAEAQEKDNFWLYIAGIIVATVVLVFMLKSRETEHLASGAVAESQAEVAAELSSRRNKNKNVATE
ncbi:MAG: hypothetical protein ACU84J_02975 [Gammaproteobacteria bacterium]